MHRPTISTDELIFLIEPQVRRYCGPLFFTSSLHTPLGNISNNGSFGLINTGEMKLLVTCHHVWEKFKELRSENSSLMFGICLDMPKPITINADSLFVDEDKRCDLVTFHMEESLLPICDAVGLEFYNLYQNHPPKINVGDVLYLIGFPGKGRQDNEDSIGFPRQPIGVQATEVGKFGFYADVGNLEKHADDFGGISGSPCFVVRENKTIRLVGFATGYAPNNINRLSFTYASYIKSNGTISNMI
jgi:hypothetical protein